MDTLQRVAPLMPGEAEDPFHLIHAAVVEDAKITTFSVGEIPQSAFSQLPSEEKVAGDEAVLQPPEKMHPLLQQWMAQRDGNERAQLLITFRDEIRMPRFPQLRGDQPRDSAANIEVMGRIKQVVQGIKDLRAEHYTKLTRELRERHGAHVLETFWLINAVLVDMPLGMVAPLLQREDLLAVEPNTTGEQPFQRVAFGTPEEAPPPHLTSTPAIDAGRARISSDPYFNLGLTGGYIGLLDTGVRFTHKLFAFPSNIGFQRDCVGGDADCLGGNPVDTYNHGTASAAIISANANMGNTYRGVIDIILDSFKTFPETGTPGNSVGVRGMQAAVAAGDSVIAAEMQYSTYSAALDYGISQAADNAFNCGVVVIAPTGNGGSGGSSAPAVARKVIGVGSFDVETLVPEETQGYGRTPDGRYKPDIQAPTKTISASSLSDEGTRVFDGTSGAIPYAAGAVALLRKWLMGLNFSIDPGQVYALLILSGPKCMTRAAASTCMPGACMSVS